MYFSCNVKTPIVKNQKILKKNVKIHVISENLKFIKAEFDTFSIDINLGDDLKADQSSSLEDLETLAIKTNGIKDALETGIYNHIFGYVLDSISPRISTKTRLILTKKRTEYFPASKTMHINIYEKRISPFLDNLLAFQYCLSKEITVEVSSFTPDMNWSFLKSLVDEAKKPENFISTLSFYPMFQTLLITNGKNLQIDLNASFIPEDVEDIVNAHKSIYLLNQKPSYKNSGVSFTSSLQNLSNNKLFPILNELGTDAVEQKLVNLLTENLGHEFVHFDINDQFHLYQATARGTFHLYVNINKPGVEEDLYGEIERLVL